MKTDPITLSSRTMVAVGSVMAWLTLGPLPPACADQLPIPTVTASARAFNNSYLATNLFAPGRLDYATAGQGACSAPLTTDELDGTWVELDFGAEVSFDRFCLATRGNSVDLVGTNRLYVGNNPVHSEADTIFTWDTAGQNGSGLMRELGEPVSGRYVRWEVLSAPGPGRNLGGRHLWFLTRPAGMIPVPAPAVTAATPPYSDAYSAPHLVDGNCGTDAAEEYAILGASNPSPFFVDLDFGGPVRLSGFDFLQRDVAGDLFPTLTLTFSDDPTFGTTLATHSWDNTPGNGNRWTSGTFPTVTARYVRLEGSGYSSGNPGGRELFFYTPAGMTPQILRQPQAGTRNLLDLVTLSVLAAGDPPLSYQWYHDGNPLAAATTSTLTINPLQFTNAGTYTVAVTSSFGSITSTPTALVVTNPPVELTAGLVAYYAFDETTGTTATDSSGNGYSATLYNFPFDDSMWVPGRIGNGLVFNVLDAATNNYVLTDQPLNFADTNLFSFVFWAKLLSDNNPYNPRFIVPVGDQHWVLWTPRAGVGFYQPVRSLEPITEVWTHFAVTYDRPNGKYGLYVNGAKVLETASPAYIRNAPDSTYQQWVIGHSENLSSDLDPWRGYLDEMRVYNRIISPMEAKALYDQAEALPPSFSRQPQSTTLFVGETLRLSAIVDGTPPIAVQWQKNGVNIPGATDSVLVIPGAQTGDAGDYAVVASNIVKTVTSATAHVTVSPVTSVRDGLAGYWKFDETTGTSAADASGLGHHGSVRNDFADGGQWTAGKVGGALQLRGPAVTGGAADYVFVPEWSPARNGTMALAAWIWAEGLADAPRIACGGSGTDGIGQFLFDVNTGADLRGIVQSATRVQAATQEGVIFPTNVWQHVVLVADGTNLRLYRNGHPAGVVPYDGTLFNPTNALSIGARMTADDLAAESGWWQGKVDDVAYWTRGLTPTEVFELFAAGTAGQPVTQADTFATAPPIISTAPQSVTVYLHESFTLQVAAAGIAPLKYQWYLGAVPLAGATNSFYTKAVAELSDAGNYSVVVSAGNSTSATSAPAALVVSAPVPTPDAGLVLQLKFDETSGAVAADASANANHGALVNFLNPDTNWVAGVLDGALLFSQGAPTADAVVVPDQPFLNFGDGPFSVALWVKGSPEQVASAGLLCKGLGGGQEAVCLDMFGGYRFFVRNSPNEIGAMLSSSQFPTGGWQHLAVIYDPGAGWSGLYIDGVLAVAGPTADTILFNSDPLDVGARQFQGGYTLPWAGMLDDLRIYDRAITPLEVRALAYQGLPPTLTAVYDAGQMTLTWPFEAIGYELQSASALTGSAWTPVPGITTNSLTVTPAGAAQFYRLHRK